MDLEDRPIPERLLTVENELYGANRDNGLVRDVRQLNDTFKRYRQSKREEDSEMENRVLTAIKEANVETNRRITAFIRWQIGISGVAITAIGVFMRVL